MKILNPINQHFVIWSFLCGDHALRENIFVLVQSKKRGGITLQIAEKGYGEE
jgi:hypothetical protein